MKQVLAVIGLAAAAAAASASRTLPAGYVHTPAGGMREDCVHAVPSGSELVDDGDAMAVVLNGRVVAKHPHCLGATKTPVMAAALAGDKASGSLRGPPTLQRGLQLPPDYDGWIEYTAANVSDTYDAFLGFFSVPNTPPSVCSVLHCTCPSREACAFSRPHRPTRHPVPIYWYVWHLVHMLALPTTRPLPP